MRKNKVLTFPRDTQDSGVPMLLDYCTAPHCTGPASHWHGDPLWAYLMANAGTRPPTAHPFSLLHVSVGSDHGWTRCRRTTRYNRQFTQLARPSQHFNLAIDSHGYYWSCTPASPSVANVVARVPVANYCHWLTTEAPASPHARPITCRRSAAKRLRQSSHAPRHHHLDIRRQQITRLVIQSTSQSSRCSRHGMLRQSRDPVCKRECNGVAQWRVE